MHVAIRMIASRLSRSTHGKIDMSPHLRKKIGTLIDFCCRVQVPQIIASAGPDTDTDPVVRFLESQFAIGSDHILKLLNCVETSVVLEADGFTFAQLLFVLPIAEIVGLDRVVKSLCRRNWVEAEADLAVLRAISKVKAEPFAVARWGYESLLKSDPAGIYEGMDGDSKAQYRIAIDRISQLCRVPRLRVAAAAVALADTSTSLVQRHIGYYLLREPGVAALMKSLNQISATNSGGIAAGTSKKKTFAFAAAWMAIGLSTSRWVPSMLVAFYCMSELGYLLDLFQMRRRSPRVVPCVNYATAGLPDDSRCLIVVPTIIRTVSDADVLAQRMEDHLVTCNDSNGLVGALTDFQDSSSEMPSMEEIRAIDHLRAHVIRLNEKYAMWPSKPFMLLHRSRAYSPAQQCWMGWERKRGKLHQLNQAILSGSVTDFSITVNTGQISSVRYVAVLDDDCLLVKDSIQRMVGALDHPLNSPQFDEDGNVIDGFAVCAPATPVRQDCTTSWTRPEFVIGDTGARGEENPIKADVRFELDGFTNFTGKGAYRVDAFALASRYRIPDDIILSHDTVDGAIGRTLFLSSATILDGHPTDLAALIARTHRWMRGDIQNALFALSRLRSAKESVWVKRMWSPLADQFTAYLGQAALLLTIVGSVASNVVSAVDLYLILFLTATSMAIGPVQRAVASPRGSARRSTAIRALKNVPLFTAYRLCFQFTMGLTFVDALVRSVTRLIVGRRTLEWTPSSFDDDGKRMSITVIIFSLQVLAAILCLMRIVSTLEMSVMPLFLATCGTPIAYFLLRTSRGKTTRIP